MQKSFLEMTSTNIHAEWPKRLGFEVEPWSCPRKSGTTEAVVEKLVSRGIAKHKSKTFHNQIMSRSLDARKIKMNWAHLSELPQHIATRIKRSELPIREKYYSRDIAHFVRIHHSPTARWGASFLYLLWLQIGSGLMERLCIIDCSDHCDNCVVIGANLPGIFKLEIVIWYFNPVNDPSANARICISPRELTDGMIETPEDGRGTFKVFPRWNHWIDSGSGFGSLFRVLVYHDDYNTSYPVMKIVSDAIKRYFISPPTIQHNGQPNLQPV